MGQCAATFTGIASIKSVVAPRTLGVIPNTVLLTCTPQSSQIPAGGTLTIAHGTDTVTMQDMRVDVAELRGTTGGHTMMIRLLDRRWRWKFLLISGRYNVHLAGGDVDPDTRKTPQELATMLLQAMYETTFDVSQLPNGDFPEVDWTYEIAAYELERICQERGCEVALNIDNTVSIVRLGVGALLPEDDDLQLKSVSGDPPEMPNKLVLVCGETQYESRLKLEAVGLDMDGKVKLINELSYMPSGGWATIESEDMITIQKGNPSILDTEEKGHIARALAVATVFRWYRVKSQADGSQNVPDYGAIDSIDQILPLNRNLLDTQEHALGESTLNKPAKVMGTYVPGGYPSQEQNTPKMTDYNGKFRIHKTTGIVEFTSAKHTPVYKHKDNPDEGIEEAELYLQTSYGVMESDTRQEERFIVERVLGGTGVLEEAIRIEELALSIRAMYDSPGTPTASNRTTTNEESITQQANAILDAYANRYANAVYGAGIWRGVKRINPDGAIRQVVFYISDQSGARTQASRNAESFPGVVRRSERQRRRISGQSTPLNVMKFRDHRNRSRGNTRGGY